MTETIGFLSVKRHAEHGYLGGFLVLNLLARPLEFHCTMPVKPSRAQELLYGPTIHDFVCGEQIAKALITKAKLNPPFIITDCEAVLSVSVVGHANIVYLACPATQAEESHDFQLPKSAATLSDLAIGEPPLRKLTNSPIAEQDLAELLRKLGKSFELSEPFQRITEALLEAHPITKAA